MRFGGANFRYQPIERTQVALCAVSFGPTTQTCG